MSTKVNKKLDSQAVYLLRLFKHFFLVVDDYENFLEEVIDGDERSSILDHYCVSIIALRCAVCREFDRYSDEYSSDRRLMCQYRRVLHYRPLERRKNRESLLLSDYYSVCFSSSDKLPF